MLELEGRGEDRFPRFVEDTVVVGEVELVTPVFFSLPLLIEHLDFDYMVAPQLVQMMTIVVHCAADCPWEPQHLFETGETLVERVADQKIGRDAGLGFDQDFFQIHLASCYPTGKTLEFDPGQPIFDH